GATHVLYQQHHMGLRVHRAYVTVHMDKGRRVFHSKNRSMPAGMLPWRLPESLSDKNAVRIAKRSLKPGQRRNLEVTNEVELLWYPRREKLMLALKVRMVSEKPRQDRIVYVSLDTKTAIDEVDNLAAHTGRGRVFDPNPVTALSDYASLLGRPPRL